MILANLAAVKKARGLSRMRHPPPLRAASDGGDAAIWARLLADAVVAEAAPPRNDGAAAPLGAQPVVSRG